MRQDEMKYDVLVVGGGPAGIFAAGHAAQQGARVLLAERMNRIGRKLAITGKGRCNLTNARERDDFIANFGRNGPFLYRAFSEFFNDDLVAFFQHYGVETKVERGDRLFPVSDDAESIVAALRKYLGEMRVQTRCNARVVRILVSSAGGVNGVVLEDGTTLHASCVILATGGKSYPATGSSGDGYRLAQEAGHTVVPPRPGLIPLETADDFTGELQGLALKNVHANIVANGKIIAGEFGEMLFTDTGVSGPIILTLSGAAADHLERGEDVQVSINFKPALDRDTLKRRLLRELEAGGLKNIVTIMKTLLPQRLGPILIRRSGIPPDKKGNQISRPERERIEGLLTDFRLRITGTRPIAEAIITRGGISLKEIDPHTMESKIVRGLYFCGELIDIDGKTGGYNLQAAFSTGYLAGRAAGGSVHGKDEALS